MGVRTLYLLSLTHSKETLFTAYSSISLGGWWEWGEVWAGRRGGFAHWETLTRN
jgi:hypothetical protein